MSPMTFSPTSPLLPLPPLFILPPMASQNLKHRSRDEPTTTSTPSSTTTTNNNNNRKAQKLAMAKRGVCSLAIAIAIPFILTTLSAYASGTAAISKTFWHPPVWTFHLASVSTSCLIGLSAWLVWAKGGFHSQPTTLPLFLAQFLLGLIWGPLVFWFGATRVGLVVCIILLATLFACFRSFRRVNPIAGDLIKPCLAWVSFLAVFNYTLV